jgi:hypothetical protein
VLKPLASQLLLLCPLHPHQDTNLSKQVFQSRGGRGRRERNPIPKACSAPVNSVKGFLGKGEGTNVLKDLGILFRFHCADSLYPYCYKGEVESSPPSQEVYQGGGSKKHR